MCVCVVTQFGCLRIRMDRLWLNQRVIRIFWNEAMEAHTQIWKGAKEYRWLTRFHVWQKHILVQKLVPVLARTERAFIRSQFSQFIYSFRLYVYIQTWLSACLLTVAGPSTAPIVVWTLLEGRKRMMAKRVLRFSTKNFTTKSDNHRARIIGNWTTLNWTDLNLNHPLNERSG